VKFGDLVEGVTVQERVDEVTGLSRKVVIESKAADLRPRITIKDPSTARRSSSRTASSTRATCSPSAHHIVANEGDLIEAGDIIAKMPRETTKVQDITGGLPRVAELFEARKPKDHAIISEIDGEVSFGKDTKGKRKVIVTPSPPRGS
jgi:DNA-directed RNA polymerase subunit beta'